MENFGVNYLLSLLSENIGVILLFVVVILFYNYYTSTHDYFREQGIPFKKPIALFGNIAPRVFLRTSFHEFNVNLYKYFDGLPYGGYFEGRRPLLIVRSPELIKTIMIKDFDHFVDRNIIQTKASTALNKMLLGLKGKEWKKVRGSLTPAFSSGKLRGMENLLQECGLQMGDFLKNRLDNELILEMKEFIGRYTLEVIGSCAFGLDCSSLKDPNAEFLKIAAKFADLSAVKRIILFFCIIFCPGLLRHLPFPFANQEVVKHLENAVMKTKEIREKSVENRRNDFMQLLLDAAKNEVTVGSEEKVMTDEVIRAQAVLFLFAGFETTSTLLSFCCAVLCQHQDLQDRLRREILKVAEKNDGKCSYDLINEIQLLEMVLLETLRMYPPVSRVDRTCTKPYIIPGTDVKINCGDIVVIPVAGILQDPEHYPDPHIFNPERFSAEEKARRPSELYLPFGMGPRNCIGLRFAMMSAKFGIFYLLKDYKLSICDKTKNPIILDRRAFLLKAQGGLWMNVESINKKD